MTIKYTELFITRQFTFVRVVVKNPTCGGVGFGVCFVCK